MIEYRQAAATDLPGLKIIGDHMLESTPLGLPTSDKILALVNSSSVNFDIAVHDRTIVGFMIGVVHESPFNHVVRASDIGLYVEPSYRHSDIGQELMRRFETWARSKNVQQIWLGQSTGNKIDITRRLYERRGYTVVGVNCVKEL